MEEKVYSICGDGDLSLIKEIGNNPNYVFENDPNFTTLKLFNDSGTVINVNSWIECANYVNGGWLSDNLDFVNGEKTLFIIGCTFFILYKIKNIILKQSEQNKL